MRTFIGRRPFVAFLTFLIASSAALVSTGSSADDRYPGSAGSRAAPERYVDPLATPEELAAPTYASTQQRGRRAAKAAAPAGPGAYFIEFRSRYALSYGHTFAAFGRLNSRGQIMSREVAGLHPAGDSSVPWMIGHVIPVPSETGPSDGDLEDQYISNRYRVTMNEADYTKLVAKIRQMQRSTPLWSATAYNCNSFVSDIARYMGLRGDVSALRKPADFIAELRRINGGRSSIPPNSI